MRATDVLKITKHLTIGFILLILNMTTITQLGISCEFYFEYITIRVVVKGTKTQRKIY